jgi:hypothetical protein
MKNLARVLVLGLALSSVVAERADAVATASPNQADQTFLAADPTFQSRVRQSFLNYCVGSVLTENATTTVLHFKRVNFCSLVMSTIGGPDNYKLMFAQAAAANATVISDATVAGTVPITSSAIAITQAAVIPDGDVNNAVSAAFNIFLSQP